MLCLWDSVFRPQRVLEQDTFEFDHLCEWMESWWELSLMYWF